MRRQYLLLAIFLLCCGEYRQGAYQIPTFADMQAVAQAIQRSVEQDGSIPDGAALSILNSMNGGRDSWGNKILYVSRRDPSFSFVLISPGSDGLLERDPLDYFELEEVNIVGQFERDILFRDGRAITNASPK